MDCGISVRVGQGRARPAGGDRGNRLSLSMSYGSIVFPCAVASYRGVCLEGEAGEFEADEGLGWRVWLDGTVRVGAEWKCDSDGPILA